MTLHPLRSKILEDFQKHYGEKKIKESLKNILEHYLALVLKEELKVK